MSKEGTIALSDIVDILRRGKKKIFVVATLCAALAAFFALTRPVVYQSEATFRERENQDAGVGGSLFEMFSRGPGKNLSHATSTMKSRHLASRVVKELDLQGCVVPKGRSFRRLRTIKGNLVTALSHFRHRTVPVFPDYTSPLRCCDVSYDGEVSQMAEVLFSSDTHYIVYDAAGNRVGKGALDEPFSCGSFTFTLKKTPLKQKIVSKRFVVGISPMDRAAMGLSAGLDINPDEDDKNVLNISYKHSERRMSALVVNTVMEQYRVCLQEESGRATSQQLEYLKKRKEEMGSFVRNLMAEHAKACSVDVSNTGFIDTEKQLEFLTRSQGECRARLMAIDLELKRLQRLSDGGQCVYYDVYAPMGDAEIINRTLMGVSDLKQQRASLKLALEKTPFAGSSQEFEGVDLPMVNQLYLSYTRQLDDIEAKIKQNGFLLAQAEDPHFDVSSLSGALADPVSGEIIARTSQLLLKARDENNLTEKEQKRLHDGVAVQRGFLANHLRQTKELAEQHKELVLSKVGSLQRTGLRLIDQQIGLKENHLSDYLSSRTENLEQEKQLLETHLDQIQKQMAKLPEKWVDEQIVRDYLNLNQRIAQEIAQLVETKSLKSNLELILSSPVDEALPSCLPVKPSIALFAAVGGFLGLFAAVSLLLFQSLAKGVLASKESLEEAGFHFSGRLSPRVIKTGELIDSDLATLRRLVAYLDSKEGGSCLLAEGRGPCFTPALATLLHKMGHKVLVLSLSFDKPSDLEQPSLLDHLEGKTKRLPFVIRNDEYDELVTGGVSRFGPELVSSEAFKKLLDSYKGKYDWVLAITPASATSAEVQQVLPLFDNAVVTLTDESLETLSFYEGRRVSFIRG